MSESTDNYRSAVSDLARSIAEVWQVCEDGYDYSRGIGTGGNLAEALSYALGLAAVTLGLDRDDDGVLIEEGERSQLVAAEALVCHRSGSWEAEHVRALTFPPDLIDHPDRP
jgi:hypothetical protein